MPTAASNWPRGAASLIRGHTNGHTSERAGFRGPGWPDDEARADAARAVTALYEAHAVGLIRLAVVMLGDRAAAEDVVQEAFCGLYRRWGQLADPGKALSYVRAATLNGCRSELRQRIRAQRRGGPAPDAADAASAEQAALLGEEHRQVLSALRRLPDRQREALVLRFYLDQTEPEIAESMGISPGTVKSTTSRGLAALGRLSRRQANDQPVMSTEERLRAATRAAAATVAPGSAPPLRLPAEPAPAGARGGPAPTPLAAGDDAAGRGGGRGRRGHRLADPDQGRAHVAGRLRQSPAASPRRCSSVPPYYVALTSTARTVARGDPGHGDREGPGHGEAAQALRHVQLRERAADDRTFVLAAQRWWPITSGTRGVAAEHRDNTTPVVFFRLRFDPATGAARLTRLDRLPLLDSTEVAGIGLSPDGTRLALALRFLTVGRTKPGANGPGSPGEPGGHGPGIQVYTLATGASRALGLARYHPFLRHLGRQ